MNNERLKPISIDDIKHCPALLLYHGSKCGISSKIAPISSRRCDFGKGFYMGTFKEQAYSIALNSADMRCYECRINLSDLRVEMLSGLKWVMFVGYNRGLLDDFSNTELYKSIRAYFSEVDVVAGDIADDSIYPAFMNFFDSFITDKCLEAALSALKLGQQYAAVTRKACQSITFDEQQISEKDLLKLREFESDRLRRSQTVLRDVIEIYRNVGSSFRQLCDRGILDASFESV